MKFRKGLARYTRLSISAQYRFVESNTAESGRQAKCGQLLTLRARFAHTETVLRVKLGQLAPTVSSELLFSTLAQPQGYCCAS